MTGAPDPPRPVVGVAADIYRVDRIEAASVGCVCEQTRYLDPRYAFFWQFVSITSYTTNLSSPPGPELRAVVNSLHEAPRHRLSTAGVPTGCRSVKMMAIGAMMM